MKQIQMPHKQLLFVAIVALAASCSGSRPVQVDSGALPQIQYQAPEPSGGTGGGTGFGGSSSGSSSSGSGGSGTGSTGIAPLTMRVGTIGYNSVTINVDVRSVLKVQFTPSIQDETVSGSGFAPQYSKLGVYIQVGTVTKNTQMLSNGFAGGSPQKSSILDFSSAILPDCDPMDMACRQPVEIRVFKPNNDYFCLNFGMYCMWANVYQTHPWHGQLSVQTDDTDSL